MNEFEQKRKIRKILLSPLVLIPLAVILIFVVRGTWAIYLKDLGSSAELNLAEERLARLRDREANISGMIDKLSTESGVESEIRDRFQMAKDGEQEIVILDAQKTPSVGATPSKPNFLQKIWNFFTN
jgi:cell division protein FtsB